MSITIKKIALILFIGSFTMTFSQVKEERKHITIFIDLKDKLLDGYSINKDSMRASFSIYIKNYEIKKVRDKAIQEFKNHKGDPDSFGPPTFSFNFYVFNQKPERLCSLEGVKYINIKEFRESNYPISSPTYIIHKLKDGTYLKWATITLD